MTTLLLADADPIVQSVFGFNARGRLRLLVASNAAEAFGELRRTQVDVLVTDLTVGGDDGVLLARMARLVQPDLRCVLMAGDPHLRLSSMGRNVFDRLEHKPVDIRRLFDWVLEPP